MAVFNGFTCDNCGNVMDADQRVKHTDRYEGAINGETREDLCVKCARPQVEGKELKPLRRRKSSGQGDDNPQS